MPTQNNDTDWQPHIDAYLSSSLSVKKYCEQNNLTPHRFQYRLHCHRQKKHLMKIPPKIEPGFVPIKMSSTQPTTVEITLPNGIHCVISTPFDTAVLKQLLGVLKS